MTRAGRDTLTGKSPKYIEQLKIQFRDVLNDDPLHTPKPNFAFYHPIKLKDENAVAYRKPTRYHSAMLRNCNVNLNTWKLDLLNPRLVLWCSCGYGTKGKR